MGQIYYLDNNATTKVDPEVLKAMTPYFSEQYFNASSVYSSAQRVRQDIEAAREEVAKFINADPKEIIFTSGGTESDNYALKGIAYANIEKGKHIITSKIEHPAIIETCKYLAKNGWDITYLNVDKYGLIDVNELKKAIRKDTVLISIMYANNEIGTIEPVEEIGKIAAEAGVYFHTDAVQAAGKIPIDVKKINVDMLSLAGHKFHGPKGIGIFYLKKGVKIQSIIQGGHQENSKRPGTENVPAIIGIAKACAVATEHFKDKADLARIKDLRDRLEKGLLEKIPDIIVNGHPEKRVDNTLNICVKHIEGEAMLIHMDFEGICVSSGSACASGSLEPSHVLLALGLPHEIAHGSIRFSFSKFSTGEDVDKVLEVLPGIVEKLRKMSPMWNEIHKKKEL
jgi:cysteine desulfurase